MFHFGGYSDSQNGRITVHGIGCNVNIQKKCSVGQVFLANMSG